MFIDLIILYVPLCFTDVACYLVPANSLDAGNHIGNKTGNEHLKGELKNNTKNKIYDLIDIPPTRTCFKLANKFIIFNPVEGRCKRWDCRGSQVTLLNKYAIQRLYSNFRKSVANGMCQKYCQKNTVSNMVDISWHWTLEEEARKLAMKCPHKRFNINEEILDINGLGPGLRCEIAATSTELPEVSQYTLLTKLYKLFENNEMNDFENGKYRRANAFYFGCTIVVRNRVSERTGDGMAVHNSPIGHFACVYCTKEIKMISTFGTPASNCPPSTKRIGEMCKPDIPNIFGCQVHIDSVCSMYERRDWVYERPGVVVEVALLPIRGHTKLVPFINKTRIEKSQSVEGNLQYYYNYSNSYNVKPEDLPFPIDPNISPDKVQYSPEELYIYNYTVVEDSSGADWIQYDFFFQEHKFGFGQGAFCCFWFFIIALILIILTIMSVIAIYINYKKQKKMN